MNTMARNGTTHPGYWGRGLAIPFGLPTSARMRPGETSWFRGGAADRYPLVNIAEDADHFYVEALLPGTDPESLNVSVDDRQLRIEGEKRPVDPDLNLDAVHLSERMAGRFARSLTLSADVEIDSIEADFKNGLLLVTLPKSEQSKPRNVAVRIP